MKLPPQPWEFRSKPAWQRLLIMVGGVSMNFLFAIVIYAGVLFAWGDEYLPTSSLTYGIAVTETGEKIGFRNGDKILSVDHKQVEEFRKVIPTIVLENAKTVQVERNGEKVDVGISNEDLALILKSGSLFSMRIPFDFEIGGFAKESAGNDAGLLIGDKITGVDGLTFDYMDQFQRYIADNRGKSITVNVIRDAQETEVMVAVGESGMLGISNRIVQSNLFHTEVKQYGLLASIPAGIERGVETTQNYLKQFKLFLMPETKAYESLGGFITIGNIFPGTWNWEAFWMMTAFISIILAIMNLLPIPALDGGHVMFLIFEMVSGRKPNEKFMEYAQIAGMVILLGLVLFANVNDVMRIFK